MSHNYKNFILSILIVIISTVILKAQTPQFSKAGFYEVKNSGREVFNFNIGWRFFKGDVKGAESTDFDDSKWDVVNTPHGLELVSTQASGCNNYQGVAWYRKKFTLKNNLKGKVLKLHFEGIMGKSKVWLNGELLGEHFGGYLPFIVDLSGKIKAGKEYVLSIAADNSDDGTYAPGKPQKRLDFTYFGGVYRDVWMVVTNKVYVTHPNEASKISGGGIFTHIKNISGSKAIIYTKVDIQNDANKGEVTTVKFILKNKEHKIVLEKEKQINLQANNSGVTDIEFEVINPDLWTPQSPDLYRLEVLVFNKKGKVIDGVATRVGIRTIDFRGKDGFFLNNKPYQGKLVGANKHQDYAVVGNAVSNNALWRDIKILKEGGCDIIRASHYPLDPASMEACDELGMFCIVAIPGWHYWSNKPIFERRVNQNIRDMVRRDRNHASVIMWEPILNETHYPASFAIRAHEIVHEEYPYQGAFTACDSHAPGQEVYDVSFGHPFTNDFFNNVQDDTPENRKKLQMDYAKEDRCVFTREFGSCVDDWTSQNTPSRVVRDWGERPQLVQAKHYANPDYVFTSWETLYDAPKQHIGGSVWHSFDHQRGYHPDSFWGGIADGFRQPKYSYYMFASQRDVSEKNKPMIFIANEMTPFSEPDVTVFTNCEEVRLIIHEKDTLVQKVTDMKLKMPHPAVIFKDVFNFIDVKNLHSQKKKHQVSLIAEGLIDGKVVATYKRMPATRPAKIVISIEDNKNSLVANGSDFVRVIASVCDENGNIKRLNESEILFEIEGEGELMGDHTIFANPKKIEWGTAPILVKSTLKAGAIKIRASLVDEGINSPSAGEIEFKSIPSNDVFIYSELGTINKIAETKSEEKESHNKELLNKIKLLEKELNDLKLEKVSQQQKKFEGGGK